MVRALAFVLVAALSSLAAADCKLGPLRELRAPPELDGRPNSDDVPWPYLALLLDRGTAQATLVDPLDPKRHLDISVDVTLGVFTAARAVALAPHGEGDLFVAPARADAQMKSIVHAELGPMLDAVDGSGGSTFVALAEETHGAAGAGVFVARVDAAGKLAGHTQLSRARPEQLRIARLADGRLAVAYAAFVRQPDDGATTLWLAWLDARGAPVGKPVRLDGVRGQQPMLDVALVASGAGVVVAWDPVAGVAAPRAKAVPIEVRAFHVEPNAAPRQVRRDVLSSAVWSVPGSAGGYMPSFLQAAPVGGRAVLSWLDVGDEKSVPLMAAPAEGGAASVLMRDPPGQPLLRGSGAESLFVFWDRNAGKHKRAMLSCGAR